jgi:quercetin dioxygenase-like cupin family protein
MDVVRQAATARFSEPQQGLSAVWLRGPAQDAAVDSALVRFAPGAATPLHVHHGGQVLYAVSGYGFVDVEGVRTEVGPGDIVVTPPGEAHIHGATDDGEFVHLSVTTGRNEMLVENDFGYPGAASGASLE